MRKLFLHVFIACTTFFFSFGLAKLVEFSRSTVPNIASVPTQTIELVNLADITDEQKIMDIYREYGPSKTIHDRAFFERVESKNFILFVRERNFTREENIRWMQSWPADVVYDYDVESIRIVGNAAVVVGQMRAYSPKGIYGSRSFIDICVRNASSWQILSTTTSVD